MRVEDVTWGFDEAAGSSFRLGGSRLRARVRLGSIIAASSAIDRPRCAGPAGLIGKYFFSMPLRHFPRTLGSSKCSRHNRARFLASARAALLSLARVGLLGSTLLQPTRRGALWV